MRKVPNVFKHIRQLVFPLFCMMFLVLPVAWATEESQTESRTYMQTTDMDESVKDREAKTLDLLSRIDAFAEQDEHLRTDAAKAHYNMGNIYFQKGEYEIAAREYYQAVTLMPDDPDAHYNLAFVSGEHLHDYKTALKHYKMYLYLNPNAYDKNLVKDKVIEAEMTLKSAVDSPLEKQAEKK